MNNLDQEMLEKLLVKDNPEYITFLENPSEELKCIAVVNQPSVVLELENPSEKLVILALRKDPTVVYSLSREILNTLSDDTLKNIFYKRPRLIQYLNNPSEEIQEYILYTAPRYLKYVDNPSEAILKQAREYVDTLSREEQLRKRDFMDYLGVPIKDNAWTKLLKALYLKE